MLLVMPICLCSANKVLLPFIFKILRQTGTLERPLEDDVPVSLRVGGFQLRVYRCASGTVLVFYFVQ